MEATEAEPRTGLNRRLAGSLRHCRLACFWNCGFKEEAGKLKGPVVANRLRVLYQSFSIYRTGLWWPYPGWSRDVCATKPKRSASPVQRLGTGGLSFPTCLSCAMLLIVNADDFGQSLGVNAGIIEAHRCGIVSSATLLANGPAFDDAVRLARQNPRLGVGLHLNLVEGPPVAPVDQVSSLVNRNGSFRGKWALVRACLSRAVNCDHVRREVLAQLNRLRAAGIEPTHFDSHQHVHVLPGIFMPIAETACQQHVLSCRLPIECFRGNLVPLRPAGLVRLLAIRIAAQAKQRRLARSGLRAPDEFGGICQTGQLSVEWVLRWLVRRTGPAVELMVHPGYVDQSLISSGTRLVAQRESECNVLRDPRLSQAIADAGFRLGTFADLVREPAHPRRAPACNDAARTSGPGSSGPLTDNGPGGRPW